MSQGLKRTSSIHTFEGMVPLRAWRDTAMPARTASAGAVTSLFTASVAGLLAVHSGRFVAFDREAGVEAVAGLPAWVFELVMPFAFGMIATRYALQTAAQLRDLWRSEPAE